MGYIQFLVLGCQEWVLQMVLLSSYTVIKIHKKEEWEKIKIKKKEEWGYVGLKNA